MRSLAGQVNQSYLSLCRYYSRHIMKDKPADSLYRSLCSLHFRRFHGFWPDFRHPTRFTEKLWSRMLHDRSDWLTMVSDKVRVRDYVAGKIGAQYLIPLLWSGDDPERIPFDILPSRYVIKATHGCGYNIIVKDPSIVSRADAIRQLHRWMKTNYCHDFELGIEWGYRNLKPSIIVESFIGEDDKIPEDFKFYCFAGRVEFLTQHFDRFIEHRTRSFDREYRDHEFRYQFEQYRGECPRPQHFEDMVRVAELLAEAFPFIRVDLYNVGGRVYFGELTPYPGGVTTRFLPASLDLTLGRKWILSSNVVSA